MIGWSAVMHRFSLKSTIIVALLFSCTTHAFDNNAELWQVCKLAENINDENLTSEQIVYGISCLVYFRAVAEWVMVNQGYAESVYQAGQKNESRYSDDTINGLMGGVLSTSPVPCNYTGEDVLELVILYNRYMSEHPELLKQRVGKVFRKAFRPLCDE